MKNKEELIQKYWSAESTLEEELKLRQMVQSNMDEGPEQALFAFFEQERTKSSSKEFKPPAPRILELRRYVLSIAASIVLLIAALWTFNYYDQQAPRKVVVDDPEVAMELTKEVFALLSGKVDHGQQLIRDNISHFDKTMVFTNKK